MQRGDCSVNRRSQVLAAATENELIICEFVVCALRNVISTPPNRMMITAYCHVTSEIIVHMFS